MLDSRLINALVNETCYGVRGDTSRDGGGSAYYKFPFIKGLTTQIKSILGKVNINLSLYSITKISSLYSQLKQPQHKPDKSNVVYKIPCGQCDKCYIGTTKNKLGVRIKQHINDCRIVNAHKPNRTALSSHHFSTEHTFNFDDVKVLDTEGNARKRFLSESLYIKLHENSINFKSDTQYLSTIYSGLLL